MYSIGCTILPGPEEGNRRKKRGTRPESTQQETTETSFQVNSTGGSPVCGGESTIHDEVGPEKGLLANTRTYCLKIEKVVGIIALRFLIELLKKEFSASSKKKPRILSLGKKEDIIKTEILKNEMFGEIFHRASEGKIFQFYSFHLKFKVQEKYNKKTY
ncbi:hypothetical protein ADUPG1_010345 [Aduncisulcus paluster]|uniref:Uncharacterized protein n=1 Tax=Aduncisulcus paluster TaxID=2918883 RepID=A0ABQ5JTI7_9EUKA|nr:hypothetical protein ADUPG1_010345 [Aduncisulcus paluster]